MNTATILLGSLFFVLMLLGKLGLYGYHHGPAMFKVACVVGALFALFLTRFLLQTHSQER